jgi:MFS family permease
VLLTITVHMVVQGLAPFISMPFCDYYGRRPTFIATLTVFVGANAGLIFSKTFVDFMLLRAVQAFGSAYLATTGEMPLSTTTLRHLDFYFRVCCHRRHINWKGESKSHWLIWIE